MHENALQYSVYAQYEMVYNIGAFNKFDETIDP